MNNILNLFVFISLLSPTSPFHTTRWGVMRPTIHTSKRPLHTPATSSSSSSYTPFIPLHPLHSVPPSSDDDVPERLPASYRSDNGTRDSEFNIEPLSSGGALNSTKGGALTTDLLSSNHYVSVVSSLTPSDLISRWVLKAGSKRQQQVTTTSSREERKEPFAHTTHNYQLTILPLLTSLSSPLSGSCRQPLPPCRKQFAQQSSA